MYMDSFKFFRGYTDLSHRLLIHTREFNDSMLRILESLDSFSKRLYIINETL
jgi:hypothetical protein